MASSFTRFLDHTQRRTTIGMTPLEEWSAQRTDLYLTTHNRQTSMPPVGFEPRMSAGERPQTYASDRTATATGDTIMSLTTLNDSPAEAPSFNTYDAFASNTNTTMGCFHLAGSTAFTKRPTYHRNTKIKSASDKGLFQLARQQKQRHWHIRVYHVIQSVVSRDVR
jgi:hypothetical protein